MPAADRAHAYLWLRLSNCGHPDVIKVGHKLSRLRGIRNWADYDFDVPLDQAAAFTYVRVAADIIQLLDDLSKEAAILARVLDAIKVYERDVLREVTWRP